MKARQRNTSGAMAWLAELGASEKGRYVIAGLILAVVSCLSLWGSREWVTVSQKSELREQISNEKAQRVSATAEVLQLTQTNHELSTKLESANRSAITSRKGKTTRDAQGNESTEWEEHQELLEQVVTQTQTERDQALTRAEAAETSLREERLISSTLRSEMVSLKTEQVTHKGIGFLAGGQLDVSEWGEPTKQDVTQRIDVDAGIYLGNVDLSLVIKPLGPVSREGEPSDAENKTRWERLKPRIRAALRF